MAKRPKDPNAYRPGSGRKYDPEHPEHFNPFHPPEGYPQDLLDAEFAPPSKAHLAHLGMIEREEARLAKKRRPGHHRTV